MTFLVGAFLIAQLKGMNVETFLDGLWLKEYKDLANNLKGHIQLQANRWMPLYVCLIHTISDVCFYSCG